MDAPGRSAHDVLSALQEVMEGFEERSTQRRFIDLWSRAIETESPIAIEAPTGSGKSFAYAIPAILRGGRTIVATRTINLQHQLIEKDLPTLAQLQEFTFALGKRFSNFACRLKSEGEDRGEKLFPHPRTVETARAWFRGTPTGDKEDYLSAMRGQLGPEEATRAWREISANADDCLRKRCRHHPQQFGGCFYFQHRAGWDAADVLVVNHSLLLYDAVLKGTEAGALLPDADWLVIDEAHEMEASALQAFTRRVQQRSFGRLCRQLARDGRRGPEGLLSGDPQAFKRVLDIVRQHGRHLVLFTSFRDLNAVHERLRNRLPPGLLLVTQSEGRSRPDLVREFEQTGWAALLGVASFWRGFDSPGMRTLTMVRLPFDVPDDPITQARIEDLEQRGYRPFRAYILPRAIIAFRQGFGRLIRRQGHRGDIHVLDGRVLQRSYGKRFLEALPPIPAETVDSPPRPDSA